MEKQTIKRILVRYLTTNFNNLANSMHEEKYFVVSGRRQEEWCYEHNQYLIGKCIDVIADRIENKQFFGYGDDESLENINKYGTAKINVLNEQIMPERYIRDFSQGDLFVTLYKVEEKDYLNELRTPEGFKKFAIKEGIKNNLDEIISTIYN
jgi:hypothetical protein